MKKEKKKRNGLPHIVIQKRETYESFATGVTGRTRDMWKPFRSVGMRREGEPRAKDLLDKAPEDK